MTDTYAARMERAARIVGAELMPAAIEGVDPLCEAADQHDDAQVRDCLVWMVVYHREQSDRRLKLDVAAVDALLTAAETSLREVYDVAQELPIRAALEALVELVGLHRDLAVVPYIAAAAARNN